MNYTYQSFNFRNRQGARPFYDLVASIAAEEFGHIELVSTAINTMLTGATDGKPGELGDLTASRMSVTPSSSSPAEPATMVQDSMGKPWNGDYVFASGDLIEDLTHNFFLETGARNNKLKVYEMVDHPAARALTGYLLVRGGVHQVAYARALENLTGANLMKLFPSPRIPTDKIPECQPHIKRGEHLKLYRFSPATSRRSRPSSTARTPKPARTCSSPRKPTPRAHPRLISPPSRRCSRPDPTPTCSPTCQPSCARPPAYQPSQPAPSPRTTATGAAAKKAKKAAASRSGHGVAPREAPPPVRSRHLSREHMGELTHLDEKLAEVLGLAQAAQTATKKVATLARKEKQTELVELMQQMSDQAAKIESTVTRSPAKRRYADRHHQEGARDQGRSHRIHEDLPRGRRSPRRPGIPEHGRGWRDGALGDSRHAQ